MRTPGAGWLVAIVLVGAAGTVHAGAPTEQVRQYTDQVQRVLQDPTIRPADKRAAVRKAAAEIFDVQETARRALGRHWQGRSPAEREEFVQLFADLLERTYIHKIDLYGGERLVYTHETVDGDHATVRAKVVTRQGTEVPVEARLHRRGDRWLIYDVAVENISLIANYRSQFDRIIRAASFEKLMSRLRSKREEPLPEGRGGPAS